MKKFIAIVLTLLFIISLSACGSNTDISSADTGSDATSSELEEEIPDGYQVSYNSVAKGYLDHVSIWHADTVYFDNFECMVDEYLYVPVGTTIICNEKFAAYCYEQKGEYLVLDEKTTTELGQTFGVDLDLQMQSGTYTTSKDTIIRFVVKGVLSDIKIYVPLELEDQVKLGTVEDFTTEE